MSSSARWARWRAFLLFYGFDDGSEAVLEVEGGTRIMDYLQVVHADFMFLIVAVPCVKLPSHLLLGMYGPPARRARKIRDCDD